MVVYYFAPKMFSVGDDKIGSIGTPETHVCMGLIDCFSFSNCFEKHYACAAKFLERSETKFNIFFCILEKNSAVNPTNN